MNSLENLFFMEDVNNVTVSASYMIEVSLKKYGIVLTPEQEDRLGEKIIEVLEEVSNGNYRHEM